MTDPAPARRRFFLDWTRILAFVALVPYHVGMYYVTWDWHIKSPAMGATLEPWMRLLSAWRMDLLFVVSGAAISFMLAKGAGADARFIATRVRRLLLPLVFGMLVVVPPQSYLEVVQKHGYTGDYLDFLRLYLTGYHGFCGAAGQCLVLPTWNHLWYLPYLLVYTVVLWLALRRWPTLLDDLGGLVERRLHGPWLVAAPVAFLALTTALVRSRFPITHALVDDWGAHAQYLPLFLLGAACARSTAIWGRIERARTVLLVGTLAAWAVLVWLMPPAAGAGEAVRWGRSALFGVQQWCGLAAALGYAARYLDRDSAVRRYLTQAVMPIYLVHQTLIILLAHALLPQNLAPAVEGPLLIAGTFAASLAIYEAVRRVAWLRPLFGLRSEPAAPRVARPAERVA
jgi:surface polysaccharide O-acyltransferase-like enzyme